MKPTHLDAKGRARMVDVGDKAITERVARAEAIVTMKKTTRALATSGRAKKGDVLAAARIAGIQAGKRTPEWIPLCHHVALSSIVVDVATAPRGLRIETTARATDRTGVEMEALVAASAAALTIYDMLKSVDRGMTIAVRLLEKRGGKSGVYVARSPLTEALATTRGSETSAAGPPRDARRTRAAHRARGQSGRITPQLPARPGVHAAATLDQRHLPAPERRASSKARR